MKLINYGCGVKYMPGYINIDGSSEIKCDLVMNFDKESLSDKFDSNSVDEVVAEHILEHMFRWEAVDKIKQFYEVLKPQGTLVIEVPNMIWVINSKWPVEKKLLWLYGGHDKPGGHDGMNKTRKVNPEFFCHKYGWTLKELRQVLNENGFFNIIEIKNTDVIRIICRKGDKSV